MIGIRNLIVLGLVSASLLIGCGFTPTAPDDQPTPSERAADQIAFDFANALMQIGILQKDDVVFAFPRDSANEARVVATLRGLLDEAGYATRRGGSDSRYAVRHHVQSMNANGSVAIRHELAVGRIELRRRYRVTDDAGARPLGTLFVRGTDARRIRLIDDRLFGIGSGTTDEPAARDRWPVGDRLTPAELLARRPMIARGRSVDDGDTTLEPGARSPGDGLPIDLDALALPRTYNVRRLGASNYTDLLATFEPVVEHLLDFASGSDRLDQADVVLIDDVLSRFDANRDILILTGFSIGGSAGAAQNRDLALRRAERVRNAFARTGLPATRVLIEGYWATAASEPGVPARAVRVLLLRHAG